MKKEQSLIKDVLSQSNISENITDISLIQSGVNTTAKCTLESSTVFVKALTFNPHTVESLQRESIVLEKYSNWNKTPNLIDYSFSGESYYIITDFIPNSTHDTENAQFYYKLGRIYGEFCNKFSFKEPYSFQTESAPNFSTSPTTYNDILQKCLREQMKYILHPKLEEISEMITTILETTEFSFDTLRLVNTDCWIENCLYNSQGDPSHIIDFQTTVFGLPIHQVTYLAEYMTHDKSSGLTQEIEDDIYDGFTTSQPIAGNTQTKLIELIVRTIFYMFKYKAAHVWYSDASKERINQAEDDAVQKLLSLQDDIETHIS